MKTGIFRGVSGRFLALLKDIGGVRGKRLTSTVYLQGLTFVVDMHHRMQ
jgi:hypothetical protein